MDANTKNGLLVLGLSALGLIIAWLRKRLNKKVDAVNPSAPIYERGKGIIRYKYLADTDDGSDAKKDCFKIWDEQKGKHIYTVPYPNFDAEEGSHVAYEIEVGKDYGATIEVVEL